jgi:hypothetical protein
VANVAASGVEFSLSERKARSKANERQRDMKKKMQSTEQLSHLKTLLLSRLLP